MPKFSTWMVLFLVVILTAFALPNDAAAHAALVRSAPAAGESVPESPAEIRLEFSEPLETTFTGADLLDSAGGAVSGVSVTIAPDNDHHLIIVPPPDLPDGAYTVAWRNLSAADGHTLQGYFGFRVGTGAADATAFATPTTAGGESVRALTRAIALIGLAALLAIAPVTLLVLDPARRAAPAVDHALAANLRRFTVAAVALALAGSAAALVAQAVMIAPGVSLPSALAQTLTETRYGQLWLARVLLLLLVAGLAASAFWGRERWRRPALLAGTVLAVVMPVPFSLLSHAAAQVTGRSAAVANDALHLLAASLWAGGLFMLAVVLAPAVRPLSSDERHAAWRAAIPRFSIVGLAAWAVLALSGLYAAWLQVGTLDALRATPYGQTLLIKLLLLVPVLALAAFHLVLGKRGIPDGSARRVAGTVAAEALIVLAVLLVVGRLIGLEPVRAVLAARTPSQLDVPLTFATDEGPRPATLAISPGAAGVNTITLDIAGQPLPDGTEGVLRFALPAQDMGAQELRLPAIAPNRFQAEAPELALPGDWQIEVIARAIGAFSWSTDVVVPIGQTPPAAPDLNPAPLFAPAAIIGMVVVAIGAAGLAAAIAATGARETRRYGIATAAVVAVIAGSGIIVQQRLPPPLVPVPMLAQEAPELATPAAHAATPTTHEAHHAAMTARHATPQPLALPGPGTVVAGEGVSVSLTADSTSPGSADVVVTLTSADGAMVENARVVILSDMPKMAMGRMETPAIETAPGHYTAELVPLTMPGEWRLAVRVSPRGAATQTFSFAVTVP